MWTVKDLEAPRSTQEIALAHVRSNYNHERLIFFSKNQTDGYGTNGRAWVSSDRSLAASMVFPLNFNIAHNAPKLLPLIFALLIARILEKAMFPKQVSLGIKWPNDLYKDGRKLGGILLHLLSTKRKKRFNKIAVLGIGINIAWLPGNNRLHASALYDCLTSAEGFNTQNFFQKLTTSIDNLDNDKIFLNPATEFQKRDIFKGEYISVAINKHQTVSGINEGIDEEGRLLIQESSKSDLTKITTGSIQWR